MLIRKAKWSDSAGIAKVHVDCWRTTYKNIIPTDFLNKLSYEQRKDLWEKNISNVNNIVFVAENSDGEIIGFTSGGKRETNHIPQSVDLTSIYIFEHFQGMGIGTNLVKTLFTAFNVQGYKTVFVEVLEDNKSKFFYQNLGAEFVKSEKIKIGGKELDLLVYEWKNLETVLSRD